MNLTPDGKKRLETIKRTLSASLPLAGLLAASVAVADVVEAQEERIFMGKPVLRRLTEERPVMEELPAVEEASTPKPQKTPEPSADAPAEDATKEQP